MLQAGADIEVANEDDITPLRAAAQQGNTKAVEVLLACGADTNAKNKDGETPYDYAKDNRKLKGTDVLQKLKDGVQN